MENKNRFMRNAAVMFAAMIISKGLGAVLKIPLGNILGGEGMGYFTTAYSIFTPVLSFACAGIPTILTRSVAELSATKDYARIAQMRRCSLLLAAVLGIAGTLLIWLAAIPFVMFIANSPESLPGVLIIAPATLFCSVTAVYRGYYEGLSDALPTALSQIIESVVKAALGIGLSYFVYYNGVRLFGSLQAALPYSAAAAILGVTISELCGTVFMLIRSRGKAGRLPKGTVIAERTEIFGMCRDIFMKALPVSLGAATSNLLSLADMLTISNCIDLSTYIFPGYWEDNAVLAAVIESCTGVGNFMYGCYAGMIMSVYMLAAAVPAVVGRCALPRLAYAAGTGERSAVSREIKLLIKGTSVVTLPVTVLMAVLSEPILNILYPVRATEAAVSAPALSVLSAGGITAGLLGSVFIVFHAFGDFGYPIRITLIGGALKLMFNVIFVTLPFMNISGAAVSGVLSNAICLVCAVREIKSRFGLSTGIVRYSLPALFGAAGCGIGTYLFFRGLKSYAGTIGAMLLSAVLGAAMYALILFISDSEDCTEVIRLLRHKRA
ncbi:MAG: oligosaccharide flippase family protein [Ruminiclostridium sp.]|nr:oligosaccharide flippase family protein [Ruminiclostridium sp.]